MRSNTFAGKVAIVTGSGRESGIGAGIALSLAREGASVVIHYTSEASGPRAEKVAELVRQQGGRPAIIRGSITTREGARKIVQSTLAAFGTDKIDILINNAGGPVASDPCGLLDMSPEAILDDFQLNYHGPVYMIQETAPHMPSGGRIVNIGAMASRIFLPYHPAYTASKAALDHSIRHFAADLGKSRGITVNTVAPGGVWTDATTSRGEEFKKEIEKAATDRSHGASRMGTVEDIADVVMFVASEKCRWITGHVFPAACGTFD